MAYVYLNGKFLKEEDAKVSIKDRGLRFGDGLFETISIKEGKIQHFALHQKRLKLGLKETKIKHNLKGVKEVSEKLVKKNKVKNGLLRIMISRGEGSMGYTPKENITPTLVIEALSPAKMQKDVFSLVVSSYQKISKNALPVGAKLMQGLNSTLVKLEAKESGFDDGLLLSEKKHICETSSANFFAIKKGKIYTPPLKDGMLAGITRERILKKHQVKETSLKPKDLKKFEHIFITNTNHILPVSEISNGKKIIWKGRDIEGCKNFIKGLGI